jgi:LytS/YehU family sensor histidine kinase
MSLDNIQLPAIVLQDLFKNSLIDLNDGKASVQVAEVTAFAYLGKNEKRVTIIVNDTNTIYLPDEELNFLMGILSACKLSMADVALVNISKTLTINYTEIEEQLHAEKILLFGVTPSQLQLPLQFPNYQIQKYNNQVYVAAPALKVLQGDKEEKTKLWNCLKQVFAIG